MSNSLEDRIAEAYTSGLSIKMVMTSLGVTESKVKKVIASRGINRSRSSAFSVKSDAAEFNRHNTTFTCKAEKEQSMRLATILNTFKTHQSKAA